MTTTTTNKPALENQERFKNRKAAHDWLKEQGVKISRGKFYGDCGNGDITVHPDGTVSRWQVSEYARQLNSDTTQITRGAASARRDELEIRRLELDVAKKELETRREDSRWLQKEEAWGQMAALIGTMLDALRHHFNSGSSTLVHLADGDHNRSSEVYEGCEELIAAALNEIVHTGRIEIMFAESDK